MTRSPPLACLAWFALTACGSPQRDASDAAAPRVEVSTLSAARALPARVRGDLALTGDTSLGTLVIEQLVAVEGDLEVSAAGLESLELPALRALDGDLYIHDAASLKSLQLPKLETCARVLVSDNGALESFAAPVLRSALQLSLLANFALEEVALAELDFTPVDSAQTTNHDDQTLTVSNSDALTALELPALRALKRLTLSANPSLRSARIPLASGPLELAIQGNYLLEELSLPAVESLELSLGILFADNLTLLELSSLKSISGSLSMDTPSLRTLELPALESVDSLVVGATQQFIAPKLERIDQSLLVGGWHMSRIALPALRSGCERLLATARSQPLPACAASQVAPLCPSDTLRVTEGCACASDGDLSASACPDPKATQAAEATP